MVLDVSRYKNLSQSIYCLNNCKAEGHYSFALNYTYLFYHSLRYALVLCALLFTMRLTFRGPAIQTNVQESNRLNMHIVKGIE